MARFNDLVIFQNRAECMNKVHGFADRVVDKLIAELDQGYRIKQDNRHFFEKDRQRLNKVITDAKLYGDIFRALISVTDSGIYIDIEDHYQVSDHGCCYYKQTYHLYNRAKDEKADAHQPRDQITAAHLVEAQERLTAIADQIQQLTSEQFNLKLLTGGL